jgi:hypothetical protein
MIFRIDNDSAKDVLVIIFKFRSFWNIHILSRLNLKYKLLVVFYDDFAKINSSELEFVEMIERLSKSHDSIATIIDSGFFPPLQEPFSSRLAKSGVKIGHMLFDDGPMFLQNVQLISSTDFILTGCPLSVLKYQELGISAIFFPLTCERFVSQFYNKDSLVRKYDISFVGHGSKCDRPETLNAIRELRNLRVFVHDRSTGEMSYQQLYEVRSSSKYTLSPAKSEIPIFGINVSSKTPVFRQLKGHIEEALFCGSVVVAEKSVHLDLIDPQRSIIRYGNIHELKSQLNDFCNDDFFYLERRKMQFDALYPIYSDTRIIENLEEVFKEL